MTKIREALQRYSLMLVVSGLIIGFVGSNTLAGTPFEMTVTAAGGVILAAGALPIILGALS